MASYAQAVRAIKDALKAEWTATPIVFENEDPPGLADGDGHPVPFVMVEIESDAAEQRSIGSPGSNVFQDTGAIIATCFVPAGTGADAATSHASALAEAWRNREISLGAGACVRSSAPQVGRGQRATSESPEGIWFAVPVTVPFEFLRLA